MGRPILGPVLADLNAVGLDEGEALLATAFYSKSRLGELEIQAERVDILVRLDLRSPADWIAGAVSPDGLLAFMKKHEDTSDVRVFCGPTAHAKVYVGTTAFLVGSANLTVRGLGGLKDEILWLEDNARALRSMRRTVSEYRESLQGLTSERLEEYVQKYSAGVRAAQRLAGMNKRHTEDALPRRHLSRPPRLGEYDTFLTWLSGKRGAAARTIYARARGEGQLSGHIRKNFFGLRQFLIAYPRTMRKLEIQDPSNYLLHRDTPVQAQLKAFVRREATDEEDFRVDTWQTYLPESSGGKPKSGGGTSGNLKRMLPLVARFLGNQLRLHARA